MSIILAKVLALYFFGAGVVFIGNPNHMRKIYQLLAKDEMALFFGGIIALLLGAFIVSVHNLWMMHWSVVITILGWWSVIKGVLSMAYPKWVDIFSFLFQGSDLLYRGLGLVLIVLSLFFAYHSWFLV